MTGGLIPTRVAVAILALVLAVAGFSTWQAAADKQDERNDRVCDFTVSLGGTTDDC